MLEGGDESDVLDAPDELDGFRKLDMLGVNVGLVGLRFYWGFLVSVIWRTLFFTASSRVIELKTEKSWHFMPFQAA